MDFPADVMLTKEELAGKLRVSVRCIENWQHEGYLPFIKVATVVMFYWPMVLTHLHAHFSVSPRGVVSPVTGEKLKAEIWNAELTLPHPTFPIRWGEGEKFWMTFPGVALGGRTTGAYPGLISFTPSAY